MDKMKFVENPEVNKKVVKIVEALKEEIISHFNPKSIILSGSFGKGEATVIENSGCLRFLSDCEVIIISNKTIFNQDKIKLFSKKNYEKTSLKVVMGGVVMGVYLQLPFLSRKLKPTMENYDLKYGSKVIYGKDYLEKIPYFKPEDIPLWEGIRLLFNRMAESLEHFSLEKPTEEMVFWTDKIVLACQDALLLCLGEYHYSYRKRNEMLQNLFQEHFSELEDKNLSFLEMTIEATERKLNGMINVKDPIDYWFDTAKICDKVFRYVIKKDMGIEFKDYLEFQDKYWRILNIRTFSYGVFSCPVYQNFISAIEIALVHKTFVSFKALTKTRTPWKHITYSLITLLYFSLSKDKGVNKYYLSKIKDFLVLFKKEQNSNNLNKNEFKYIKNQCLDLWHIICC
jgi:hypothetical protein